MNPQHRFDRHPPPTPLARLAWALLGLVALAVAALGLVLPVFPGLPFAVLAALCFATASRRLQLHLERVPAMRRPLRTWQRAQSAGPGVRLRTALALMGIACLEALRWLARPWSRRRGEVAERR